MTRIPVLDRFPHSRRIIEAANLPLRKRNPKAFALTRIFRPRLSLASVCVCVLCVCVRVRIVSACAPAYSRYRSAHVCTIQVPNSPSCNSKTSAKQETMASGDEEKHELHTGWSIWEQRELGKGMAYGDKLFKLCSFRTVEEFWAYWNNIPKPRYCEPRRKIR